MIGAPLGFFVSLLLSAILAPQYLGLLIFMAAVYFVAVSSKVKYDYSEMKQVDWEGVPEDVVELLTTTSGKGEYANLRIVQVLNHKKVSESGLHRLVHGRGVGMTLTAFRKYIDQVEKAGLMSSPETKETQAKQYSLTERGNACKDMLKIVLPRSYYMFFMRNYLGVRKIPMIPPP